ncbi:MAG TPA: hypothetical protein PKC65_04330 [Pyrinomonadaceae bacterium]|nr:hypothetical protein [Pyrinomonadaceae bacterium]
MDTANLPFAYIAASLFGSFLFAGIGLVIGRRVFPEFNLHRSVVKDVAPVIQSDVTLDTMGESGRLLPTEILGLEGNIIRYRDGSFGKAFLFEPANTLYDDGRLTEQRIEDLKTILKFDKPPNTIIQFRFINSPDTGEVLRDHLQSRDEGASDPIAGVLHATNLSLHEEAIRSGCVMRQTATVWIRVPVKDPGDKGVLSSFLPSLLRDAKENGIAYFLRVPILRIRNSVGELAVEREMRVEAACRSKTLRVFQSFEANFPKGLQLREMTRSEVFEALFISHRREHMSAPVLSNSRFTDIRRYLCSTNLESTRQQFVRHNGTPASLVSLKSLPNGFVTADVMRYLTATRNLCFPHEIVVDLMINEKQAAKKDLQKRIDRIEGSRNTWLGFRNLKKDAVVIKSDLENLLEQVEADNEEICRLRMNVIVFAERSKGAKESHRQLEVLDDRCDAVVSAIRKKIGADAVREDAVRQRALYPRMLSGELSLKRTGQELTETADSVIVFVPTETSWRGSKRPHSIFTTPNGQMFGLDLYDRALIKSPTVIVTAASGEGKSFLASMLITDIRAHRGNVKVRVMDYRHSFKPICRLFGGRHIEFTEKDPKPINIWNYPGIENGVPPSKRQLAMVLTDILILSKTPKTDAITSAIASTVIDEVYKMALARNGYGRPKFQPTLGHFLDILKSYHWKAGEERQANELYLKLNIHRKDLWLNAPTHPAYDEASMFDVFELSGISSLDEKIRESVGFRISAQIMQEIGEENSQNQKTPILFLCDEMREINRHFPAIQELIAEATVTGRKEGLVTVLFSQAYEHFTGTAEQPNITGIDLVKNSGVKMVGKQIGGFERLADDCELAPETISAIRGIRNQYGRFTQWVFVIGSGVDKIVQMAEIHLSPAMLWANTNDTNEANARRLVESLRPDLPLDVIVTWLADKYPQGLTSIGLTSLSDADIQDLTGGMNRS